MKQKAPDFQSLLGAGFKSLVFVVFSLFTFFVNQLNGTIASLTSQLKTMEIHQIDTDKRVSAIEVAREINTTSFQKALQDIQEMKATLIQNTMRVQTISDFVVKNLKIH